MEDLDEEKIASQEYIVLKGACSEDVENQENFKADGKIVPQEFKYFIDGISKIKRLREVKALCSFSRVNPSVSNSNRKEVVSKGKTWLPALENFGEGIFIDFESEHLKNWETNKEVILRVEQSTKAFRNAFLKDGKEGHYQIFVVILYLQLKKEYIPNQNLRKIRILMQVCLFIHLHLMQMEH